MPYDGRRNATDGEAAFVPLRTCAARSTGRRCTCRCAGSAAWSLRPAPRAPCAGSEWSACSTSSRGVVLSNGCRDQGGWVRVAIHPSVGTQPFIRRMGTDREGQLPVRGRQCVDGPLGTRRDAVQKKTRRTCHPFPCRSLLLLPLLLLPSATFIIGRLSGQCVTCRGGTPRISCTEDGTRGRKGALVSYSTPQRRVPCDLGARAPAVHVGRAAPRDLGDADAAALQDRGRPQAAKATGSASVGSMCSPGRNRVAGEWQGNPVQGCSASCVRRPAGTLVPAA